MKANVCAAKYLKCDSCDALMIMHNILRHDMWGTL